MLELRFQIPSRAFYQDIDLLTQSALVLQELSVIKDWRKKDVRRKNIEQQCLNSTTVNVADAVLATRT